MTDRGQEQAAPHDAPRRPPAPPAQRTGIIGHTLGGCRVLSKLGEGGMGSVFKAHDHGLDRMVAIKILPPSLARDESYRERFLREARALARVTHQNLVQVYSVAVEKGLHFFSMEHIEGESLMQRIRRGGPMLLEQILAVSGQVLSALAAIHAQGITHRDIKSSNIMIDRTGRAVLMDLGLAKDQAATGVTTAGVIIGTPEYMSPEQAMGETATPLSDIYSIGIVLYEMASGGVPFRGKSAVAVLRQQCEGDPDPLAVARPDLPKEFIEAVSAAMKKSAAERPQSAAAMAELLLRAGQTPELAALASSPAGAVSPLSRAPTLVDHRVHSAPTVAAGPGIAPESPEPSTALGGGPAPGVRASRWKRVWFTVLVAAFVAIVAGLLRARQVARRRAANRPAAVQTDPRPRATVHVGGRDFFPGRTVRLVSGGVTREHIEVMFEDGTTQQIPLRAEPEVRYEDRE